MSQTPDPLIGEVRFRVPLPVVIPLASLAVIGLGAYGFSRVLLSVDKDAAVAIAIVMAANLLGACAFLASRKKVSAVTMVELALVVLYPVIIGIAIAEFGLVGGESAAHEGAHAEAPAAGGAAGSISAASVQFNTDSLSLPADEATTLAFANDDTVQHNVSIYPTEADADSQSGALFEGEIIDGGASTDYEIDPLDPGEYVFQCDIHPAMRGTVAVE